LQYEIEKAGNQKWKPAFVLHCPIRTSKEVIVMAKDFAVDFYRSKAWQDVREYIYMKQHGICERCGELGKIVHHKKHLTPQNINDPAITLGEDNLELLCQDCHNKEHMKTDAACVDGVMFDEHGDLVRTPPIK